MQREVPWVANGRKLIGLREIKGANHAPEILQMWKDIKRGGIKDDETPWCFTGNTQVMTEEGWIRFDELNGQRVYQADEEGSLTLANPIVIVKEYDGDVFAINHRSVKLVCDVGHRWWGTWGNRGYQSFGTLDELTCDGLSVPTVRSSETGCGLSDEQITLLAAFISDGKYRYSSGKNSARPWSIEFEVSKVRKVTTLRDLSPDNEYLQSKVYGPLTKMPLTVFRFRYPTWFDRCFTGYKKLSKVFLASMSCDDARKFLSAYCVFDGDGDQNAPVLYSSDVGIVDDLVFISTLAGYHAGVQHRPACGLGDKPTYAVTFSTKKKSRTIRREHVSRHPFVGLLYCVQVPNGRIVVRGEGSAPVVTGNCAAFVGAMLERSGIQSSRFESAKSYLSWGEYLAKPIYGCVVIFSRDGGGHVGFVVGKTDNGDLLVLGGNQSDAVNIKAFSTERVSGYRWPKDVPITGYPLTVGSAERSTSEA